MATGLFKSISDYVLKTLGQFGERADADEGVMGSYTPAQVRAKSRLGSMRLVQVRLYEGVTYQQPADDDVIFCLDIRENDGALSNAVKFVRSAHDYKTGDRIRHVPTIFAIADFRALTPGELLTVHNGLVPSGALLFDYPEGCHTFAEAMRALGEEVTKTFPARNYARPRRARVEKNLQAAAALGVPANGRAATAADAGGPQQGVASAAATDG